MGFDPKTDKYPYPESTDKHYIILKKNDGTVFDENYPYIDRSFGFRFKRFWVRLLLRVLVFPLARIRLGLRIKGRKNLKRNRELLKGGALSCSNHVHFWDYIAVMDAVRPHRPNVLVWAENVRGENKNLIRLVGGIPIPENSVRATLACMKAAKETVDGGWLHVYAEGSMWEYYRPIRPFKSGIGYLACRTEKPIVPMAFSYRRPGWIRRKIFRQIAVFDLVIGEPLFPNGELGFKEREEDLVRRCHETVCRLAGITPEEDLYPPIFNDSKRVDYYTDVYGKDYGKK